MVAVSLCPVPWGIVRATQPQPVRVRWVLGLGLPPGRVGKGEARGQGYKSQCFQHLSAYLALARVTDCDTKFPARVTDGDRPPWRAPPATWSRPPCVCPGSRPWPLAAP